MRVIGIKETLSARQTRVFTTSQINHGYHWVATNRFTAYKWRTHGINALQLWPISYLKRTLKVILRYLRALRSAPRRALFKFHQLNECLWQMLPQSWQQVIARWCRSKRSYEAEIATLKREAPTRWLVFRRMEALVSRPGMSKTVSQPDDRRLVGRILDAYNRSFGAMSQDGDSMWMTFFQERHQDMHRVFASGDVEAAAAILRDPSSSDLFYGFDNLYQGSKAGLTVESSARWHAQYCYDGLLRLAESAGAASLDSPEAYGHQAPSPLDPEVLIERLEKRFGISLDFPNPYPHEHGINTSRGVMAFRVPQAIYQAWRIHELMSGIANRSVVEIGAGLGRTAYYARRFGISNYTIVDIPFTSVSQAYFLGQTLGEENICLFGEHYPDADNRIRIVPQSEFLSSDKRFGLVANIDSMTEMKTETAHEYWSKIKNSAEIFLSINHEANLFRVHDLITQDPRLRYARNIYWMRQGYAEEVVWLR